MKQESLFSTFECECGFKSNTLGMEKHLKKHWTFENHSVNKNGHSVKEAI